MKFSKFCFTLATAVFAAGAFADAANVLISFSTTADTYADGTPVKDGEWYALCWSADDAFDGLTVDCNPVNPAEKVLVLMPIAKGGRCPYVLFQVDSKEAPKGGNYFVYLLDTRDVTGAAPAAATTTEDGRSVPVSVVNGSAVAQNFTASASIGSNVAKASSSSAVSQESAWVAVQPRITAFEVKGAEVKITVAGMMSGLTYKVNMGEVLDNMTSYEVTPQNDGSEAYFIIEPDQARFFKIVAE